jgi:hypothetical protein
VLGIAAQLTRTKFWEVRWTERVDLLGHQLLAVPLSPLTSTVASVGATWSIRSRTCTIAGELPTSPCPRAIRAPCRADTDTSDTSS